MHQLDASKHATNFTTMVEEVIRVYLADFKEMTSLATIYMYPDVEPFSS